MKSDKIEKKKTEEPAEKKEDKKEEKPGEPKELGVPTIIVSKKDRDDYYKEVRKVQLKLDALNTQIARRTKEIQRIATALKFKHRDANPTIFQGHLVPSDLVQRLLKGALTLTDAIENFECIEIPESELEIYYSIQDKINEVFGIVNEMRITLGAKANQIADEYDYIGPLPADIDDNGKIIARKLAPPQAPQG